MKEVPRLLGGNSSSDYPFCWEKDFLTNVLHRKRSASCVQNTWNGFQDECVCGGGSACAHADNDYKRREQRQLASSS